MQTLEVSCSPPKGIIQTLISQQGTFRRLQLQWKVFPTSMQQAFLRVMRADIIRKNEKAGQKVKFQKETAYAVHPQELDEYAKFLQQDLERAGNDSLDSWEEESSMTEVNSMYDGVDPTRLSAGANESYLLSEKDNDEENLEDDEEDPEDDEEDPEDNEDLEEDYGEEG